ncbi:transmembrane inner ear expressed protein [Microplitis mediator]|uniref:transmembrane inner ear expressed protein n=1 Tax=Microplitis mediator TaxID=375433 RepID=UPI0025579191|nr:transmembrane inner ear expressed protein [Microplitis mediator]
MELPVTKVSPPLVSIISCSPKRRLLDNSTENENKWLEQEIYSGLKVWQLVGIILTILMTIIIVFCCCVKFRVPRTKQNIEADYVRKRITKNFRKELTKISNTDIDKIDLKKALAKVQADIDTEINQIHKEQTEDNCNSKKKLGNFHARFLTFSGFY